MKQKMIVVFVCLFIWNAPGIAIGTPDDFRATVESIGKEFVAGIQAKEAARVGALYATNAIAYPPNSEMIKGREAIQNFWKGLIDAGLTAELEVVETENQGNLGMETGKYKILAADGKTVDHGKYVVVWKQEGGAWKLYRDIWNTSMPAAAPAKE